MTAVPMKAGTEEAQATRPCTLVWVDAREAVIVQWHDGQARLDRVESDVPAHHRATGQVRHNPAIRHGGGGPPQTAGEPHRLEHLARFVDLIAERLPAGDDVFILGPGTVRGRLERLLRELDGRHERSRSVHCEASPRLTDRQLIARLHEFAGDDPRRRTVGAYRWDEPAPRRPSGRPESPARRVVDKPPRGPNRSKS